MSTSQSADAESLFNTYPANAGAWSHGASTTLVDILKWRARHERDRRAFTFPSDSGSDRLHVTYGELDARVRAVAARLQDEGLSGSRALLLYPSGIDYVTAFLACLYAGVVAVPAYPPDPSRLEKSLPRLRAILDDAGAAAALTTTRFAPTLGLLGAHIAVTRSRPGDRAPSPIRAITTDTLAPTAETRTFLRPPTDALAFIQYTSGSTRTPKGVMVSHGNLMHNAALIQRAFELTSDMKAVIWLPLYHDMGLIGGILQPLAHSIHATILSPLTFLRWPRRWLNEISRTNGCRVVSGGPSFAYELCVRRMSDEDVAALDLSRWSIAFCGAEPINPSTMERFATRFAPCGFKRAAFYPCYGLAEATLFVSGGSVDAEPVTRAVKRGALESDRVEPTAGESDGVTFVGCGRAHADAEIRIVSPRTLTLCADDEVGEIWVAGRSVARGYWNRPAETRESFRAFTADTAEGPFLRTGDLGFVRDGELFVTGRLKDLIIIRGANYYPQDIEHTVHDSHDSLRRGYGAAFSIDDDGDEKLVVVHEAQPRGAGAEAGEPLDAAIDAIRHAIASTYELEVHAVVLIRPRTLPKTSSGKLQRNACRAAFLDGRLDVLAEWRAGSEDAEAELAPDVIGSGTGAGALHTAPDEAPAAMPRDAAGIRDVIIERLASELGTSADRIDPAASFPSLGIDSLRGVELAGMLEDLLGVPVSPMLVWEHGSIEAAADHLARAVADRPSQTPYAAADAAETSREDAVPAEFPLSHNQQALWFQHRLEPGSVYNIVHAVTIRAPLDVGRLHRALQCVVDRHPSLRTTIGLRNEVPVQRVAAHAQVAFTHHDAAGWSESRLDAELEREARKEFDLERGPLFRVAAYTRGTAEHVLLVAVHHIVADLWSLAIVASDLAAAYDGSGGANLPRPAAHYSDFVRWQNERLSGQRGRDLGAWWKRALAGELPVLDVPADRPRPPVLTYDGAIASHRLAASSTRAVQSLARRLGVTPYVVLLAAFKLLLSRYAGASDLIVGTPALGRQRADFAGVVGYFVNPVPIRAKLSPLAPFTRFVEAVADAVREALPRQDYPFALTTRSVQPVRDPARTPIFQVMFILQKAQLSDVAGLAELALGHGGATVRLGSLELASRPPPAAAAPFDLTMMMAESEDGLKGSIYYNSNLFEHSTMQRMLRNYEALLEDVCRDPARPAAAVAALSDEEKNDLLRAAEERAGLEASVHAKEPQSAGGILMRVDTQVAAAADTVAVDFEGSQLTYGELDRRAERLGAGLRARGIGPEDTVGVCVERSLDMIVALLGVLKAGAAFLPLDPAYPRARLEYLIRDACVKAVVTAERVPDVLRGVAAPVVTVDDEQAPPPVSDTDIAAIGGDHLAYVIYTSGSTGLPKGVELHHRGLDNFVRAYARRMSIGRGSRYLQFASFSFDAAVAEIFLALTTGATLCVFGRDKLLSNTELLRHLRVHAVTAAILPPSRLSVMEPEGLPAFGTLMAAGEACTPAIVRRWARGRRFFNGYGPTEATIGPTIHEVDPAESRSSNVPVGRPIDGLRVYVLNEHQQLLPVGARGEICIAGMGVARGYRRRPDLTAEKFLPDPFAAAPGARMYRTGDVGRRLPDGTLECLGRLDDQVKIRGFRIELGEIEAALESLPGVADAAVFAIGRDADTRLAAYVVPRSDAAVDAAELKTRLRGSLPEHMIPSTIATVSAMPLTPNGKVDQKALAAAAQAQAQAQPAAPRNDVERQIAAVWRSVLNVEQVGIDDNFFELGGHSLSMALAQERLQQVLGQQLSITDLFRYPTVATLASFVRDRRRDVLPLADAEDRASRQRQAARRRARAPEPPPVAPAGARPQ